MLVVVFCERRLVVFFIRMFRLNGICFRISCLVLNLERLSMLLSNFISILLELWVIDSCWCCFGVSGLLRFSESMLSRLFSGVWILWFMLVRKLVWVWVILRVVWWVFLSFWLDSVRCVLVVFSLVVWVVMMFFSFFRYWVRWFFVFWCCLIFIEMCLSWWLMIFISMLILLCLWFLG